ncbi:hypothetical protein [Asticcacaulis machinosus]|uniref:Uncharacterized protein n=1 Tax=Asticcacaulis machinosus TaxID=2984211 RepID=A0ABT5HLA6_9CAUL|nr:hypothetical protein [Asticcacaulis machinosus]MDC7677024.1 hypothetical protein [Asticcacaulis machinosus]
MRIAIATFALVLALPALAPSLAVAEEWDAAAADTPKPVVKRVPKKTVVKKKTEPAPTLPSAPVPYTSLKPSPPTVQAAPLKPITSSQPVAAIAAPNVTDVAIPEPPPPAAPPTVIVNLKTPPATKPSGREITLKCDTVTTMGKDQTTRGTFYLSLIPSETFPDTAADFKVMSIDPDHSSIIRDTLCFSFRCNAAVSPTYYELVDQTQKKGGYLKVSLNRTTGAFYGQKHWTEDKRFGRDSTEALSETGTCRPQSAGGPILF